jgi:hypothetical protein
MQHRGRREMNTIGRNTASQANKQFDQLEATELYCPKCKTAVPVRARLLLVLPEGDKYEYLCVFCGASVGDKIDRNAEPLTIIS